MGRNGHGYGAVEREKHSCRIDELLDLYVISLFLFTIYCSSCALLYASYRHHSYVVFFLCIKEKRERERKKEKKRWVEMYDELDLCLSCPVVSDAAFELSEGFGLLAQRP